VLFSTWELLHFFLLIRFIFFIDWGTILLNTVPLLVQSAAYISIYLEHHQGLHTHCYGQWGFIIEMLLILKLKLYYLVKSNISNNVKRKKEVYTEQYDPFCVRVAVDWGPLWYDAPYLVNRSKYFGTKFCFHHEGLKILSEDGRSRLWTFANFFPICRLSCPSRSSSS